MSDDEMIAGRVAVVTGGASGIGRATCSALARRGARIVVVDLNQEAIDETVAEIAAGVGAEVLGLRLSVADEQAMTEMALRVRERFSRIDILVACAGILRGRGCPPRPLAEVGIDEWDQVIGTNLTGTFLSNRAVLADMVRQRSGQIINVSSTSGLKGRALDAAYSASKFGIIGLSEALAEEVRYHNIRVQVVIPDAVATPLWHQNRLPAPPDSLAPERVAELIVFMLALPPDAVMERGVIAPFRTRRKRGPAPASGAGEPADLG
ncbi:MAG: SDR family oxidoreductase [Thermoanaerobaculales bacterium]|jgi:NAD(P)-dependent dehydrogenase (short-subunit alcohol dehydrogenase family)|nr:SDR family oxidoreductase [Thermoanaerobaculales bacterium]